MMSTLHPVIAIDGPAASGKSTIARQIAQHFQYTYVDTGAMYRAYTWLALQAKITDLSSSEQIKGLIRSTPLQTKIENNTVTLLANGTDVSPYIRNPEVNQHVSTVAAVPQLREYLVNLQRQLRLEASLVMEGRDIGTVVFTDTPYKFFLDADPNVRASRRNQQGEQDSIKDRDRKDSSRASAPLTCAADAEKVDTTHMTIPQVVDYILNRLKEKGLGAS